MSNSSPVADEKPSVLIIGGLGYIGRFLALYLHKNQLASEVRIVDKHLPELAWLAPEFSEACSRDKFLQADASREANMARIFDRSPSNNSGNGKENSNSNSNSNGNNSANGSTNNSSSRSSAGHAQDRQFDYVFNCGGETRYSQDDEVYRARSLALSLALGREAARRKIKCFVELSTGMVYKPDPAPRKESARLKPWLRLAKWKLQAEEELTKIEGLNLCVLRLAHVYGPYASNFLGTALCLARVYQSEGKEMKWLWGRDLRTNTVHVEDVARALWTAAGWYVKEASRKSVPIFNIVDHGNTSQGTMANIIHDIFSIPTVFQGTLISQFARMHLDSVVDDVNDETLDPWADLQRDAGIQNSMPLNPFMEKELLKDTDLSLDGGAFTRETGFQYKHPKLTKEEVEDVIESYRRMNWWP